MRNLFSTIIPVVVLVGCSYIIRDEGYQIIEATPIEHFDATKNKFEVNGITISASAISTPIHAREKRGPYKIFFSFIDHNKTSETVSICDITVESLDINGFSTINQSDCIELMFESAFASFVFIEELNVSFKDDEEFRVKFSYEITGRDGIHRDSLNLLFAPKLRESKILVP